MTPNAHLRDGTPVHIAWGRPGAPPDRPGWVAPASSRLWVLHAGTWWESGEHKSRGGLARDLAVCDSWEEAVALGVVRASGIEQSRCSTIETQRGTP